MASFRDVLVFILEKYRERYDRSPTKTKLLKIAYLGELGYYRAHRKRLTETDWIYYLYGPWTRAYDETLERGPFEIEEASSPDSDARFVKLTGSPDYKLSFEERVAVAGTVGDFGGWDLDRLLDYVYFDTEPMLAVEERGDVLDFSVAKPPDAIRRPRFLLEGQSLQRIKARYRARLGDAKDL